MYETNTTLQKLYEWSVVNSLEINMSKSKAVLFRPKNRNVSSNFNIVLGLSQIELVQNVKTLGVYFNNHLSWNDHIINIAKKLSKVLGKLYQFKNILPCRLKLLIYKALFEPILNYCSLVWSTTSQSNLNKLHILQKKAVRIIRNVSFDTHTRPLFKELHLTSILDSYEFTLLTRYRSTLRSNEPFFTCISNLTPISKPYDVRERERWKIPFNRTNYGFQMLSYNLPLVLNKVEKQNLSNIENLHLNEIRELCFHK